MIDNIIVFSYLAMLLIVGVWHKSTQAGFKGFSRIKDTVQNSKLMIVATIFSSTIGGGTTFGVAEKVFADNIAYSCALFLVIPVDILIAKYIVPRLAKHHGSDTVGDIMAVYYGKIGRYIAGASAIMVSIGLVAAQISVSGRIFEYILHIDYFWSVVCSYSVLVIYTTIGGFRSILFTNRLQFFAILFAIPVIAIFGIYQIGVGNFITSIPYEKVSITHNPGLFSTIIYASLGFAVMNLFPTFIQRALISKDSRITTKAVYIKSVIFNSIYYFSRY